MDQSLARKIVFVVILFTPIIDFGLLTSIMLYAGELWRNHLLFLGVYLVCALISMIMSLFYLKSIWDEIELIEPQVYSKSIFRLAMYQMVNTILLFVAIFMYVI